MPACTVRAPNRSHTHSLHLGGRALARCQYSRGLRLQNPDVLPCLVCQSPLALLSAGPETAL